MFGRGRSWGQRGVAGGRRLFPFGKGAPSPHSRGRNKATPRPWQTGKHDDPDEHHPPARGCVE
ncbi:hypothetical protein BDV95DRAFT_560466 [Massariosphaeria phaeospora]|uniref:Uncharacterized protein n=1 Tax=Massariosphaeria phaeospora TaxID=100035 RepID=A0A7C8IG24_9PLEO|nr:hypothetical protein BDV95DRAFT_560466 [Massariosphaeria phaeospora]